ncbi:unnamed protein product [Pleuronectes platessa]|uniref:Uncharacterized protein n=1 Tax=Pleuronectes platessa TaxID=8262 RepID=A0A9N7TVI2_PLEPL|nr:unnamed protein product [Pleuronectes platessa]
MSGITEGYVEIARRQDLSQTPADSFCLVDNSVIETEGEGKAGGVVKKHSMKAGRLREVERREREEGGGERRESREPGHWGEVVRACLKQYTQGFSQSSHTQCARSMSLTPRRPPRSPSRFSRCAGRTPSCVSLEALTDRPSCGSQAPEHHALRVRGRRVPEPPNNSLFVDLLETSNCSPNDRYKHKLAHFSRRLSSTHSSVGSAACHVWEDGLGAAASHILCCSSFLPELCGDVLNPQ